MAKQKFDLESLTVEELVALQEGLDAERLALKERARAIAEVRGRKEREETAAYYGLTVAEYEGVKAVARGSDAPNALGKALGRARKDKAAGRPVQVARAEVAAIGVEGVNR